MGFLGEMLVQIYYEIHNNAVYVMRKVSGKNEN